MVWAATDDTYSHFGLSQPAFGPITEPGQIFRSSLVEPLVKEILAGSPVLAVRGGPGVGKTTFMHVVAMELAARGINAVIVGGVSATPADVQALIAQEGELGVGAAEPEKLLRALWDGGVRRLVLLCDNAETLSGATFRSLALLLELRFSQPVRVQLVLLGSMEPWAGLGHPDLDVLRAATAGYVTLSLRRNEATAYLDHRLSYAGQRLRRVMTQSAAIALREEAHGNPRRLDELAEKALVHGSRTGRRRLTARSVRQALMVGTGAPEQENTRRVAIGAAAAFLVAAACGVVWLERGASPAPAIPRVPAPGVAAVGNGVSLAARKVPHITVLPEPRMGIAVSPRMAAARGRVPATPQPIAGSGPGLVLVAGAHDDMPTLYRRVYKGLTPPAYSVVQAANPMPVRPGALVIFPAPPSGWAQASK